MFCVIFDPRLFKDSVDKNYILLVCLTSKQQEVAFDKNRRSHVPYSSHRFLHVGICAV